MAVHSNSLPGPSNGTTIADQSTAIEHIRSNSDDFSSTLSPAKITLSSDHIPLKVHMNVSKLKNKKRTSRDVAIQASPSSSSSTSGSVVPRSSQRGLRLAAIRRNPRFLVRNRASDADMIAFPLGMSVATVVSQVFDRKDSMDEKVFVDIVSKICTSAIRESIANVFGNKYDSFTNNFEKSFGSTLSTLRLIRDSPIEKQDDCLSHLTSKDFSKDPASSMSPIREEPSSRSFEACGHFEEKSSTIRTPKQPSADEEIQHDHLSNSANLELSIHENMSRQLGISYSKTLGHSNSMISTFEKSVVEQARANDLKTLDINLTMRKLRLKESQLSLKSDSNLLERVKVSMDVSKASFKAEQFKNKVEDARYAELLTKCIDCLVAGLLIMSAFLVYGAYVYSFKRITDATNSCSPSTEFQSWSSRWIPKPVSSVSSGLQTLTCLVQVFSRMLFGIFMVLAIAYLLIQRAATVNSRQTMPITFILLLLGVACGVAGKFCIDTLGGSGYHWLVYWEVLCSVHFFANIFTSALFFILYGSVRVTDSSTSHRVIFPFWIRRLVFYLTVLVVLPLLCGLLPFASFGEWRYHFTSLFRNIFLVIEDGT